MKDKRFIEVLKEGSEFSQVVRILVDTQTGVNYLEVKSGYGLGLTPLLDSHGNPVITSRARWEVEK